MEFKRDLKVGLGIMFRGNSEESAASMGEHSGQFQHASPFGDLKVLFCQRNSWAIVDIWLTRQILEPSDDEVEEFSERIKIH